MNVRVTAGDVDLELWGSVYDVAGRVRDLAPWKWMNETDVFGVEISTRRVAFVSVMGAAGEHYAVAVYPGAAALTSLRRIYEDASAEPERVLEIPQVQLSFEDSGYLTSEDRRTAKRLGLTFKGKSCWPMFRSYLPGFAPWFVDTDEAKMLLVALTQLLEIAPRQRTDPALIRRRGAWEYLVRAQRAIGAHGEWADEVRKISPDRGTYHVVLTADHVRQWRALPVMHTGIEADFFLMRTPIHEGNERPYYPYLLLLVEAQDGLIAGHEMLTVGESLSQMCASVPGKIVEGFARLGLRPAWITVRPGRLEAILRPLSEALGLELRVQRKLRQLDPAKQTLFQFLAAAPV